jgi:hypothetical protein
MAIYEYFLKFYGMHQIISERYLNPINQKKVNINIDAKTGKIKIKASNDFKLSFYFILKTIMNLCYIILIGFLLLIPCMHIIITSIYYLDIKFMSANIFNFLPIIQYYIGIIYYKSDHFSNMLQRNQDYSIYIVIMFIFTMILSIIISILTIIGLVLNLNISIYSNIYGISPIYIKVLICCIVFIIEFYGNNIILSNIIIFSSTFYYHSIEIEEYSKKLQNFIKGRDITLEEISIEHAERKSHYKSSIDNLNLLFITILTIGIYNVYFVITNFKSNYIGLTQYISLFIFMITIYLFIHISNRIKSFVSDIKDLVGSGEILKKFLGRVGFEEFGADIENNSEDQMMIMRTLIRTHENGSGLNWLVLVEKLSGSWDTFKFFGFDIEDSEILQRFVAVGLGLIMILDIDKKLGF